MLKNIWKEKSLLPIHAAADVLNFMDSNAKTVTSMEIEETNKATTNNFASGTDLLSIEPGNDSSGTSAQASSGYFFTNDIGLLVTDDSLTTSITNVAVENNHHDSVINPADVLTAEAVIMTDPPSDTFMTVDLHSIIVDAEGLDNNQLESDNESNLAAEEALNMKLEEQKLLEGYKLILRDSSTISNLPDGFVKGFEDTRVGESFVGVHPNHRDGLKSKDDISKGTTVKLRALQYEIGNVCCKVWGNLIPNEYYTCENFYKLHKFVFFQLHGLTLMTSNPHGVTEISSEDLNANNSAKCLEVATKESDEQLLVSPSTSIVSAKIPTNSNIIPAIINTNDGDLSISSNAIDDLNYLTVKINSDPIAAEEPDDSVQLLVSLTTSIIVAATNENSTTKVISIIETEKTEGDDISVLKKEWKGKPPKQFLEGKYNIHFAYNSNVYLQEHTTIYNINELIVSIYF